MPRLSAAIDLTDGGSIQFLASPSLDMMNALYFTALTPVLEGVEGWPVQLRTEMAPDLLAELDFLLEYPAGDPGLVGTLADNIWIHPELWDSVQSLIDAVRSMPDGIGELDLSPGIQGLIYQATFRYPDDLDRGTFEGIEYRKAIERRMRSLGDRNADEIMSWYDRPRELRERLAGLVDRFYREHYQERRTARMQSLQRSVAKHREEAGSDPEQVARRLTGRAKSCLEAGCPGPWERHLFAPSMDMGVYNSCATVDRVHGLFYPLEPDFPDAPADLEETRLARIYKALSDEQRLRILRLLPGREMYSQEIVEATGLHQSVVSRHLSFMKAVGLVESRRQNNMKFFRINPEVRQELNKTLELFAPAPAATSRTGR